MEHNIPGKLKNKALRDGTHHETEKMYTMYLCEF